MCIRDGDVVAVVVVGGAHCTSIVWRTYRGVLCTRSDDDYDDDDNEAVRKQRGRIERDTYK